jgi:hypothetical protein
MELSELLSAALVAFTIEVDNEFEARMPHHTTQGRRRSSKRPGKGRAARGERGPWLVSLAMYENCLRWVPAEGIAVGELEGLARTPTNLDGMLRWGYVAAESPRGGRVAKPGMRTLLRPTADGLRAGEVWGPLPGEVEGRWRERFGAAAIEALRGELAAAVEAVEASGAADDGSRGDATVAVDAIGTGRTPGPLPDTMPIVGYGLSTRPRRPVGAASRPQPEPLAELALHALLARLLTAFALTYEAETGVSLALGANLLAVLGPEPVRLRDLPTRTGVAKEPVATAVKFLAGRKLAAVAPDPDSPRGKVARLTAAGERAQEGDAALRARIEADWGFGGLVAALAPIAGDCTAASPLFDGLEPPPRGWRAAVPTPERLPRFPLVTHRGGFPDGS